MKNSGLDDNDIAKSLKDDFSNVEIDDAMNQASQSDDNILDELDQFAPSNAPSELLEETPEPEEREQISRISNQSYREPMQDFSSNQMQEIAESIVEEKWEDFISKTGDINLWKETINNDIEAIKQEVLRTQERFNNLQNILIGKVTDYNKSVLELNSEMKSLEQVMQKIIEPLTTNVKELGKIAEDLKKKK
jgi:hypothetical protein